MQDQYIYIVVSKTETVLGKAIRKALKVSYNHCSLSLDESLNEIYSFGRKELNNMFRAGFVVESKRSGFFAEHGNSKITVVKIPVSAAQKQSILHEIERFRHSKELYHYSIMGLIFCYLGIVKERRNKLFCSQFVTQILEHSGIQLFNKHSSLIRPHDFLSVENGIRFYTGTIGDYVE